MTSPWAGHWTFDPETVYLTHGTFGACPRVVLEAQAALRLRLEREPVQFLVRDLEGLLDEARRALATFVGADPAGLVFVPNATTGVNTVLRALRFEPGDEILTTDHAYAACRNALERVAAQSGARTVVAPVPFPIADPAEVESAVLAAVTPRTKLALLDHVTSPTGLVWPIARLVAALAAQDVDTLVDGAHAPGMVPLDLGSIGAAYYTGNCHKWICAPKVAGFLVVRSDRRARIQPLVTSHGAKSARRDRSPFHEEFDWPGTFDPTACLAVPVALRFMGELVPGGWPALMERNRDLALQARRLVCDALGIPEPAPASMIGALAAVPLPPAAGPAVPAPGGLDPLVDELRRRAAIEIPVFAWPAPPRRILRLSSQLYNHLGQYELLARVLVTALAGPNEEGRR